MPGRHAAPEQDPGSGQDAGAGPPAVAVSGLTVRRGRGEVLHGLDFGIDAGRITGLLGPSGSGKTTLMRAIVGVQRLRAGSITVLGLPAGHPLLRRDVGYVTQSASIYPDISVADNVRYFAALHGKSAADVAEALAAVSLEPLARQKTGNLSGGQFSRVSLACALVSRPRLLILDEPTVGLDPVLRAELWAHFARLAAAGTTLLVSSHVMEEAGHCDSLLLLRGGGLLARITPAELGARGGTADLELAFLRLIRQQPGMETGHERGQDMNAGGT